MTGDPAAPAVVLLHGGPGSGRSPTMARWFDPAAWRVVQFDQRSCGHSEPHASEPAVDLSANTTAHLIADIEVLRTHLGIERWVVAGASWGTTLGLAYAEAHPDRVAGLLFVSVVTTTRAEVDWVTRSMGRVFPEEWQRFHDAAGVEADDDLCAAYSRLLHDDAPDVRDRAAAAWCAWEDTHVATSPGHRHDRRYDDPRFRLCFARLVTHYW
ncbi:MAG: alpha/beta fold hydrolase, partial [Ilumatobacteraceae bacterium]